MNANSNQDRDTVLALALRKSQGLGALSDRDLLLALANDCEQSTDTDTQSNAACFKAYASKHRRPSEWRYQQSTVPARLAKLADAGDYCAAELLERLRGKGGEHVNEAATEYWQGLAEEFGNAGNDDAAALCEHIAYRSAKYYRLAEKYNEAGNVDAAALCKLIADKHDGGRHLITTDGGKAMDRRIEKTQAKLDEYEYETAGMAHASAEELATAKRLAAKYRPTAAPDKALHAYRNDIRRARIARAERSGGHPNWRV